MSADAIRSSLLHFQWIENWLSKHPITELLRQYDDFLARRDDPAVALVYSALSNSAHILYTDKSALAHQLMGRLIIHQPKEEGIRQLLDTIMMPNQSLSLSHESYPTHFPAGGLLFRRLIGHYGQIYHVCVMDDGRIVSCSEDSTIRIWTADGDPINAWQASEHAIHGVLILPNQTILSWGTEENDLQVWRDNGKHITSFIGHTQGVLGASLLSDERLLTWSYDKTVRLWSLDGQSITTFTGYIDHPHGTMQLPDGQLMSWATSLMKFDTNAHQLAIKILLGRISKNYQLWHSDDNIIRAWAGTMWKSRPIRKKTFLQSLERAGLEKWGYNLSDGRFLSWDTQHAYIWSNQGELLAILKGEMPIILYVGVLANGSILVAYPNQLKLWNGDGQLIHILTGHWGYIIGALSLPNDLILTWGQANCLWLWSADGHLQASFVGHTQSIQGAMKLHHNRIISWGKDDDILMWHIPTSNTRTDNYHLVTQFDESALTLNQDEGMIRYKQIEFEQSTAHNNSSLELSDGRIVKLSRDGTMTISANIKYPEMIIQAHKNVGNVGLLGLRSGAILTWGGDKLGALWREDGDKLATLRGHREEIIGMAELTDGRLVSWADDEIRLWSQKGKLIARLETQRAKRRDLWDDRFLLIHWATVHDFHPHILLSDCRGDKSHSDNLYVGVHNTKIIVYDYQQRTLINQFYADITLKSIADIEGNKIQIIDALHRKITFQWIP